MELSAFGLYKWQSQKLMKDALKGIEEENRLDYPKWFPDTDAFFQVAYKGQKNRLAYECDSYGALAGLIIKQKNPIDRLNFFSHGKENFIGCQGTIIRCGRFHTWLTF